MGSQWIRLLGVSLQSTCLRTLWLLCCLFSCHAMKTGKYLSSSYSLIDTNQPVFSLCVAEQPSSSWQIQPSPVTFIHLLVHVFLCGTRSKAVLVFPDGRLSWAMLIPLEEWVRLPSGVIPYESAHQTRTVQTGIWCRNLKWPVHRWKTNLWDLSRSHLLVSSKIRVGENIYRFFHCFGALDFLRLRRSGLDNLNIVGSDLASAAESVAIVRGIRPWASAWRLPPSCAYL